MEREGVECEPIFPVSGLWPKLLKLESINPVIEQDNKIGSDRVIERALLTNLIAASQLGKSFCFVLELIRS